MKAKDTNRSKRLTTALAMVLVVTALALAGCVGSTPGGPSTQVLSGYQLGAALPTGVRTPVLAALSAAGVQFDPSMVQVTYGRSHDRAVVTGPLQGRPELGTVNTATGTALVGYGEIDLTLLGGKWVITGSKH
jgi:hypothetical protein